MTNKGICEIPLFDPILPKMDCPLFGVTTVIENFSRRFWKAWAKIGAKIGSEVHSWRMLASTYTTLQFDFWSRVKACFVLLAISLQVLSNRRAPNLWNFAHFYNLDVINRACFWGYSPQQSKSVHTEDCTLLGWCIFLRVFWCRNDHEGCRLWCTKVLHQLVVLSRFFHCHCIGDLNLLLWNASFQSKNKTHFGDDVFVTIRSSGIANDEGA